MGLVSSAQCPVFRFGGGSVGMQRILCGSCSLSYSSLRLCSSWTSISTFMKASSGGRPALHAPVAFGFQSQVENCIPSYTDAGARSDEARIVLEVRGLGSRSARGKPDRKNLMSADFWMFASIMGCFNPILS